MKLANVYRVIAVIVIVLFALAVLIYFGLKQPDEEYSIEFLTPETVKVTGSIYLANKELRQKYVIKKIEPTYGDPKRRYTATEYIITIERESSQ